MAEAPRPPGSPRREQEIVVPPLPAALSVLAAGLACGAVAAVGVAVAAENPPGRATATGLGVAGSTAITLATGFSFYGSRPRPAGAVQTRWMGATVARFMAIPALAISIHFFLPAGGLFAVLAAVGAYLGCFAAETATVAWLVNRRLDRPPQ
ncbi:MAG: hypothetical protein ACKORL_09655 [Phycisphaerales bacterium]